MSKNVSESAGSRFVALELNATPLASADSDVWKACPLAVTPVLDLDARVISPLARVLT